jgi:hypothetical protein
MSFLMFVVCGQIIIHNVLTFLNPARRGRDGVKEDTVMCKKLIYLISFILVLGLATSAESANPFGQDPGPDGIVSIEAENFDDNVPQGGNQWVLVGPTAGFTGTAGMQVPDAGNFSGGDGARLDYEVNFVKTGTHYIWILAWSPDGSGDSCHVGLDGQAGPLSSNWSGGGNNWSNDRYPETERAQFEVTTPGMHVLNIWVREDGLIFDKIVLTTDPDYRPTGEGPEESWRGAHLKAYQPVPADGALHEDTWVSLSWSTGETAVSQDVYFGENFNDVNDGAAETFQGNQPSAFFVAGFPGFPYPDGLIPGTTYYWRIDEVNDLDPNSPWRGDVWSFKVPPKTAYAPDPADAAEQVDPGVTLRWTAGFGSKLHTVYFGENFDDVNNAAGGFPQGTLTYTPGPLKLAKTYYWRVDEFDITDTYKGDVWSFTTEGAVGSPDPANGAVDVKQTQIITWSPSVFAASHEIYFGSDEDAVKNADSSSPEYKGTRALDSETYDPGMLEWDSTYYWRIDEVNSTNPDSPWTGPLWSFTTASFLIVDDFEDYDSGDNQIWYSWKDGLGYAAHGNEPAYPGNGTGSAVGDENTASFTEETIVHGGNQSMPFWYDNSILRYSEVEKTLSSQRDWTENSITTLSVWFRGNSANAAETLYVALNGSAVVYHDDPSAALIDTWTQWTIDLQEFAAQGVNLANVNTISIGFGDKNNLKAGGSGIVFFDDIRLYAP